MAKSGTETEKSASVGEFSKHKGLSKKMELIVLGLLVVMLIGIVGWIYSIHHHKSAKKPADIKRPIKLTFPSPPIKSKQYYITIPDHVNTGPQ